MDNGQQSLADLDEQPPQCERLRDSIWKPWYAKLWWVAIPIYWLPASGPTGIDVIDDFYRSKLFPYTSPFFLPLTAFLILAFGYLSRRLDNAPWSENDLPRSKRLWEEPGNLDSTDDPYNPRSGWRWNHRRMFHRDR